MASVSNRTSLKFCDAFESYMDSMSHKTDCYNRRSRYKTHLKDGIGHYRLGDITPLLLLKLKSKLLEEDAVKTGKPLAHTRKNISEKPNAMKKFLLEY